MSLIVPQLLVLDTATLGTMSRDYRSRGAGPRSKVVSCVKELASRSIYLAISWTQVTELFRHENADVFYDRFRFFGSLPHIAWIRPYRRDWHPGCNVDVLLRELHVFKHGLKTDWGEIVSETRTDFWETGVGEEMFGPNLEFWEKFRALTTFEQPREATVASVSRVDYGVDSIKLSEVRQHAMESPENWPRKARHLAWNMHNQIQAHGDQRFTDSGVFSKEFAINTFREIDTIHSAGKDVVEGILESTGVPKAALRPEHTVGDLGELAVYLKRLTLLCNHLNPPCLADICEIPVDSLPSYEFQRRLSEVQRCAHRVAGSDIGDTYVAGLALYADFTEVDKRTYEYISRVRRHNPKFRPILGSILKSAPYETLVDRLDRLAAA